MPQDTPTAAEQQQAAQLLDAQARRTSYIFVSNFLEHQRNAEILRRESRTRMQAKTAATLAFGWALWDGSYALEKEAARFLREVMERGQLLFAFDGTTVLQGGAA